MVKLVDFDAAQIEPLVPLPALPAGKYNAVIVDSVSKSTKTGGGNYLEFTFEVSDGAHKGRKLWSRLNLENPSAKAVELARAELSAICRAVGVMRPTDSAELHNRPLVIDVRVKRREDTDEMGNEIRGYEAKTTDSSAASSVSKPSAVLAMSGST